MRTVDEGRTLLCPIVEHCFEKRRIKEIGFFTEISNEFVAMNNRDNTRNFLSFLVMTNNILEV